jgi:precorrin-4/cobalt-precorrin-4 C11-methyltransferase
VKVYIIGAGPGAVDLLTIRAADIIRQCGVCVYAGSLVNPEILNLLDPGAQIYDSSKMDLGEIVEVFREAGYMGVNVARLHTGDPSVYGAINEQMRELDKLEIEYEIIPGVSSFQAAAGLIKSELTTPELTQTVILTRISGRTKTPEQESLDKLAKTGATLCVFLSASRIEEVARMVLPHYGKECPAHVVYRATWSEEIIISASLGEIARKTREANITKTAMILIGKGLDRSGPYSKLYDSEFSHQARPGRT